MSQNKNLDSQINEQLRQHYDAQPRPNFLPALKSELMENAPIRTAPPQSHTTRKTAWIMAGALTALALILFITPVRDAIGQVFVELFQQAESNEIPCAPAQTLIAGTATAEYQATISPNQIVTPGYEAIIGPDSVFTTEMILFQVERAAEYDILEPAYLPDGFELVSASFEWETGIVHLVYESEGENSLTIDQEPVIKNETCDLCTEIGPGTAISVVQIGDLEGEYVNGGWKEDNGNSYWASDPDMQTLRWQSDNMELKLSFHGSPDLLTKADLVEIADNLVNRIIDPSSQEVAILSVDEVEQAAGFDVLVPSSVPSIFKFSGGNYLPEQNMTVLFYDLIGRSTNGLRIAQEPITGSDDCDLCSEIGPAANIQTVQIGDTTGELVNGVWAFENGYKVWKNEPWVVKLRWQTNDTVFEISFFGPPMTMTKRNMAHLAESMTSSNDPLAWFNITPTATPQDMVQTPDPSDIENATMSLDEVKEAAGYDILTPSYLAGQGFYGANYDASTAIVYLFYDNGLLIRQEPFTSMADCQMCIETRYGATIRSAMVDNIEAEYLFGVWSDIDANNLPFSVPQPKQLRWQENNTFFDITYDHDPSELELDDLIAIAESLQ